MRKTYTWGPSISDTYVSRLDEKKNSHFFHTIFVLKTLSGLNFFLAVEEVLGGSLALGRLLRLFKQLGMDLRAHPGSVKKNLTRGIV